MLTSQKLGEEVTMAALEDRIFTLKTQDTAVSWILVLLPDEHTLVCTLFVVCVFDRLPGKSTV